MTTEGWSPFQSNTVYPVLSTLGKQSKTHKNIAKKKNKTWRSLFTERCECVIASRSI